MSSTIPATRVVKSGKFQEDSLSSFAGLDSIELLQFLREQKGLSGARHGIVVSTSDPINILNSIRVSTKPIDFVINLKRINDVRWINRMLESVNHQLELEGTLVIAMETPSLRKQRIMAKFPAVLNSLYFFGDYIFKRVFPKLPVLKNIYFFITSGRNRVISQAEVFGRLYYCGYKINDARSIGNTLYIVAEKSKTVLNLPIRNYGPIFKMKRVGKHGKLINVYKIRTMCAYSEYLQEYVFEKNNLEVGGKIKDDFRITTLGALFRKSFLDEVPMLFNVLKGDLKLVGVRPISQHYFSLYDDELKELRLKVKPGLVPPFYADMPKTLEEIIASEKQYIRAYLKKPLVTDLQYLFKAFYNIIFLRARSR